MGYTSQNKATIDRIFAEPRHFMCRVFCDELNRWKEATFNIEIVDGKYAEDVALAKALDWISKELRQLSM